MKRKESKPRSKEGIVVVHSTSGYIEGGLWIEGLAPIFFDTLDNARDAIITTINQAKRALQENKNSLEAAHIKLNSNDDIESRRYYIDKIRRYKKNIEDFEHLSDIKNYKIHYQRITKQTVTVDTTLGTVHHRDVIKRTTTEILNTYT